MNHQEKQELVKNAIAEFPGEFGLSAFPGEVFKVSEYDSYYSGYENAVLLYTHVKKNDRWHAFAKGTVSELRRSIVR